MKRDFNISRYLPGCLTAGLFFFILVSLWQVRCSFAQEATINDFTVTNSESHLLLYLTVVDWFTHDMEDAIHNGIPITIAFKIELFAERLKWPDTKIIEHEFNHIMEYDSLKKEYKVDRNEQDDTRIISSLEEALKLMSEINGFKVLPLDELEPQLSYKLRAKAKLARKTLPLSFHYLMPFSSPWDFETAWYELTLKLAP